MDVNQILTSITRETFNGDDDPRIGVLLTELMDDFQLETLEIEAEGERAVLRESGLKLTILITKLSPI